MPALDELSSELLAPELEPVVPTPESCFAAQRLDLPVAVRHLGCLGVLEQELGQQASSAYHLQLSLHRSGIKSLTFPRTVNAFLPNDDSLIVRTRYDPGPFAAPATWW